MNKGKTGKVCPFSQQMVCGENCGLFCIGLKSCVFHALNKNIMDMRDSVYEIKEYFIAKLQ